MNNITADVIKYVILPYINANEYWILRQICRNFRAIIDTIMREYYQNETKNIDKTRRYLLYYYLTHMPRKFLNFESTDQYFDMILSENKRYMHKCHKISPAFPKYFPNYQNNILENEHVDYKIFYIFVQNIYDNDEIVYSVDGNVTNGSSIYLINPNCQSMFPHIIQSVNSELELLFDVLDEYILHNCCYDDIDIDTMAKKAGVKL